MRLSLRVVAGCLLTLGCVSCARFAAVPLPEVDADNLVGRDVRVTTTDGRILEFEVMVVEQDALIGRPGRVPFGEIATLERREVAALRTAGVVVGVAAVAAAVGLLVLLVQWVGLLGGT